MLEALSPYKYLFIGIAIVAMLSAAYYKGYSHEHDKLISYQAQAAQAAKDQETQNVQANQYIANSYNDYYQRLIARLHNQLGSKVPGANSSQGSNGAQQELSGTCKGSEFYSNALEDVLKLQSWQEWASRNGIKGE